MPETNMLVLLGFFRMVTVLGCVLGAVYLMLEGKDGWGWLLFVAIILGSWSMAYTQG